VIIFLSLLPGIIAYAKNTLANRNHGKNAT
jgi:hypothetical protein